MEIFRDVFTVWQAQFAAVVQRALEKKVDCLKGNYNHQVSWHHPTTDVLFKYRLLSRHALADNTLTAHLS